MAIKRRQTTTDQFTASPQEKLSIANQVLSLACVHLCLTETEHLGWDPYLNPSSSAQSSVNSPHPPNLDIHPTTACPVTFTIVDLGIMQHGQIEALAEKAGGQPVLPSSAQKNAPQAVIAVLRQNGFIPLVEEVPTIVASPDVKTLKGYGEGDWVTLQKRIYDGLMESIAGKVARGAENVEIRIVTHVSKIGYGDLLTTQPQADRFCEIALEAYYKVLEDLGLSGARQEFVLASNGTKTTGKAIAHLYASGKRLRNVSIVAVGGRALVALYEHILIAAGADADLTLVTNERDFPDDPWSIANRNVTAGLKCKLKGTNADEHLHVYHARLEPIEGLEHTALTDDWLQLIGNWLSIERLANLRSPHISPALYYGLVKGWMEFDGKEWMHVINGPRPLDRIASIQRARVQSGKASIKLSRKIFKKRHRDGDDEDSGDEHQDFPPPPPPPPPLPVVSGVQPELSAADDDQDHPSSDGLDQSNDGGDDETADKRHHDGGDKRKSHDLPEDFMPGGVSTKEFEAAFVDRGNWPVLTVFSLGYPVASTTDEGS